MKQATEKAKAGLPSVVLLQTRPAIFVTCPHCWTDQRAERDTCFRCGARFVYAEEAEQGA